VVTPDAASAFGSTSMRSPAVSSRPSSATRNRCCSGGCVLSAKYIEPPSDNSSYDVDSTLRISSNRCRTASRNGNASRKARVRASCAAVHPLVASRPSSSSHWYSSTTSTPWYVSVTGWRGVSMVGS
jgi:hypothetical protein